MHYRGDANLCHGVVEAGEDGNGVFRELEHVEEVVLVEGFEDGAGDVARDLAPLTRHRSALVDEDDHLLRRRRRSDVPRPQATVEFVGRVLEPHPSRRCRPNARPSTLSRFTSLSTPRTRHGTKYRVFSVMYIPNNDFQNGKKVILRIQSLSDCGID